MKKFLEQLLCKHKYSVAGTIEYKGSTYFLECMLCGKRKVVKDGSLTYSKQLKTLINMWKKREIEIDFEGTSKDEGNR